MSPLGTLAARCRSSFTSRTRERGRHYVEMGCVELAKAPGVDGIFAQVRGSRHQPYAVEIYWDGDDKAVIASCECPVALKKDLCKHIFATLLNADTAGNHERFFPNDDPLAVRVESPLFLEPAAAPDPKSTTATRRARWRTMMDSVAAQIEVRPRRQEGSRGARKRLEYHVQLGSPELQISLVWRNVLTAGGFGKAREASLSPTDLAQLDPIDSEILAIARGCENLDGGYGGYRYDYGHGSYGRMRPVRGFAVTPALAAELLPRLSATERFGTSEDLDDKGKRATLRPLAWDDAIYDLVLVLEAGKGPGSLRLRGELRANEIALPLTNIQSVAKGGIVVFDTTVAMVRALDAGHEHPWLRQLWSSGGSTEVPKRDVDAFMEVLADTAHIPTLDVRASTTWSLEQSTPQAVLRFVEVGGQAKKLAAQLWFRYRTERQGQTLHRDVRHGTLASAMALREASLMLLRDRVFEREAHDALTELGFATPSSTLIHRHHTSGGADFAIAATAFVDIVKHLSASGWRVEADGRQMRTELKPSVRVSSGVDWFEVSLDSHIDEAALEIPELLRAVRRRDPFVTLSDGSRGLLPEAWLERYGALAALGTAKKGSTSITVARSAGILLDAMLAEHMPVDADAGYTRFRKELASFDRMRPAKAPAGFQGTLREYQSVGLGWLKTIARFGLGGCLADDMGLGKTVQVLALLAARPKKRRPATLVVAPKSLVFNWLDEARRFAPKLRVESYAGPQRKELRRRFDELDIVVTTYGTVRRDIAELREHKFHYVVLDEASAIKNPASQIAKACRLLSASHRLALTGTPIENRLSDLASILEFLNPGMIRASQALTTLVTAEADEEEMKTLSRALKPLLLRRTKEHVLSELPDKTEQVLRCDLDRKQRRLYDELRDHYRALLSENIATKGLGKSKIHVLEALLRLRQAACHPGLIDESRKGEPSAKLDALLDPLLEVVTAGHKALVFSQFTSFLAIVKLHLDKRLAEVQQAQPGERKIEYAYLDGKTRKRKAQVDRFQTDPNCAIFLISLKAGGHGLNLTAAEYVFLLDPWWNPAVEAQAIDRAHRIGQQRPVFAYRMIADDTVEDRVLDLQRHKRELAEGIFAGERSLLGSLTAEDLSLLLS